MNMSLDTDYLITYVLTNFGLVTFVLATLLIIIHRLIVGKRVSESEIVYRWIALFSLGLTSIYAGCIHLFYPIIAAINLGWTMSPFQKEVAIANFAFGLLGILSFRANYGFRLATVVGSTCWLWGDAANHIYRIVALQNYSIGNAGSWLIFDIITPLILIICVNNLRSIDRI